jgi:bifunctional enzyme CysN/CysC
MPINIHSFLDQDQKKDLLRLLTAGSVDDGKSTLIGRLLFDSKKVYEDHLVALERDSKRMGHAGEFTDYALLLDGLKAEREQGITIDVAYRYFSTNKRKFIIADTPGHEQYTRNMATGASTANLAIILIDATQGVITQTKRHTFIVSLLGIRHVVLAVNKMDLIDYDQKVFDKICDDYRGFVARLNIPDVDFIPLAALHGCNVVQKSQNMPWYNGKSLLEFLESVHVASDRNFNDFRFPVQYVIRPNRNFRGFAGKVASGIVSQGDKVMALPSRKISRVKEIVTYNGMLDKAFPPQSVTITLEDEIDISRGEMLVHPDNMPKIGRQFEAMLVWMDEEPMDLQKQYYLKHNSNGNKARIDMVRYRTDVNSLDNHQVETLSLNEIGRVVITTVKPLLYDLYLKNRQTGSFVLIDPLTHNTAAVGMIIERLNLEEMPSRIDDMDKARIERGVGLITKQEYENFYKQKGETIWITGLHGSGKNELAFLLEKQLFNLGATVVLLEGSAVRSGLSRELDFTAADRAEHLRRVAHVCRLLNDQGIITICSFISPGEDIRKQVAGIIGPERFHLIFMDASLDYCKQNKPDLYEKASRGETSKVAGLDATYEKPVNPVLIFKPEQNGQNPQRIIEYLRGKGVFPL